ncbi:hypothetical protein C1H46_038225 [Malus baccata]|uniref:Uncharacterized protein n=1 Tax=Malus baccata TaxID=106549 RepID=A0A540KPV3_MALBA|nr:hypothetical protein C1H46_038225 [Malus baccata]
MSFFITESPMVRGPVGNMKNGSYMLSGEGRTAFSPRFKSKRQLEGPYIFRGVKERKGRTSQDRLASSLLSLGVTRFLATTAAVMSFFIIESPTVRGPVGDMKDGSHMLSGEGRTASSPRFKSKQRSEGPDIFRGVKERKGRTSQDRISARREFIQAEIQV